MQQDVTLQSLIDTHEQPFAVLDQEGQLVAVNRAWEGCFGYRADDVIGQLFAPLYFADDVEAAELRRSFQAEVMRHLTPASRLFVQRDAHGDEMTVRVRAYPLTDLNGQLFLGEIMLPLSAETGHTDSVKMVGKSPLFAKAVSQLQKVAGSETPILIEGETGTGKELAAAFVHAHSSRRAGPFVTVDCTVLNEDLFESELFGHERGAFTGSVGTRKGLFEIADGGTLFMDELGEMPLAMQSKLLRALESGTFRRVGSNKTQRSDVRLVSATNRSLSGCVSKGDFRQDLFYRVAVFTLTLPPLRDRDGDLLILAATLLKSINRTAGLEYSITPQALQRLAMHPFPGNVRELKNILQLAAALCDGDRIDACDIQIGPTAQHGLIDSVCEAELMEQATGYADEDRPALEALESDYVAGLLAKHNGSRAEVAEKMGISERTLYRKLKRYGLN